MIIEKISPKQAEVFRFMFSKKPYIICDGAVRSGKTIAMVTAFVMWAMNEYDHCNFAICGKTVTNAERNIILPLMQIEGLREVFDIGYKISTRCLTVKLGDKENYFYCFGGKDESSYMLIQGITLGGVLLDEAALMPRSFIEQAMARTLTYPDAKIWFNCNPESPAHWFYQEWVLKANERDAVHLHFLMSDNPVIGEAEIAKAASMYTGVFYQRYILGEWVKAEGRVYPNYDNTVKTEPREYSRHVVSMDYGIQNPTAMLLWGLCGGVWYAVREYYHSGRETGQQKTDQEYFNEYKKLTSGLAVECLIIDPSASSFIALARQNGVKVRAANNEVLPGIQRVALALQNRLILFNDCCKRTLEEFDLYSWDDGDEDKVIKEHDHSMDCVRYFTSTMRIVREEKAYRSPFGG